MGGEGVVGDWGLCTTVKVHKITKIKLRRSLFNDLVDVVFGGLNFFFVYWFTSDLARFLPPSFPLLALGVIIASRPARMKLHVNLALFAR